MVSTNFLQVLNQTLFVGSYLFFLVFLSFDKFFSLLQATENIVFNALKLILLSSTILKTTETTKQQTENEPCHRPSTPYCLTASESTSSFY